MPSALDCCLLQLALSCMLLQRYHQLRLYLLLSPVQHDWQPRKHIMMMLMMLMMLVTKTVVGPACILCVTSLLQDPL